MKFKKDINGLRGIAVIAVVLFHFNESWLPGGFAGVDVFFVISGFLMTGIIFRGIEQESFSVLKFYIARANRIIPALAFLCLVLLIWGLIYLEPLDFRVLGKHVGSSIGFLSNIVYWSEDGYFDVASHEKWLLHTWSLSVEWQFYIIYPLVLVTARKFLPVAVIKSMILGGTILGFIFCVIATYKWPSSSYYFLTTRAWEMMVGGVCYLYPFSFSNIQKKQKVLLEWFGLSLIIASYIFINKEVAWPGYLAVFPVLGSFLMIQAQRSDSFITCNIVFQKLGTWSYSIYLWHWPIVVAIYFYSLNDVFIYVGILLSVFLGFISNKYIEKINFKNNFNSLINYVNCKPLYMVWGIGVIGSVIFLTNGLNFRSIEEKQLLNSNALSAISDWNYPEPNLQIGSHNIRFIKGSSDKNILFIGASHIEQTFPYVSGINTEYNIYYLTEGGCFLTPSYTSKVNLDCSNIKNYKDVIAEVDFERIVTSLFVLDVNLPKAEAEKKEQLDLRISEFNEFLYFVKNKSKKVFVILGEPKGDEFNPTLSVRHNLKGYIAIEEARKAYATHYGAMQSITKMDNLLIIDPIEYLCSDICMVRNEHFKYYYKDSEHMRPWYAKKSLGYLDQIFNNG
ncbi:acyltransferase family protein [Psychromonas ingrahamii]|uniref:acyltransferase family protein n=1 Tax=Psychromonas ingrahamii TaxID=357794 RepID=UPI00059EF5A2|nr:acyltransferase family protein [Psychromonas ingrahamii]